MRDSVADCYSPHQYINQFEKWGLHKYETPSEGSNEPDYYTIRSQCSPKTSHNLDGGNGCYSLTPNAQTRDVSLGQTNSTSDRTLLSTVDDPVNITIHESDTLEDDCCWPTSNSSTCINKILSFPDDPSGLELDDFGRWIRDQMPVGQTSLRVSRLDTLRPIDTYSPDEIWDIKRAADFLVSLMRDEDAFHLYLIVLDRLKNSANPPPWMVSSAMIACARSAKTPLQTQITQILLEQTLHDLGESTTDVESFVFRMLLATTYSRRENYSAADSHTKIAMGSNLVDGGILMYLPQNTRSLDIITYYYLSHALGYHDDIATRKTINYLPQDGLFVARNPIRDRLLRREPGPFELKYGSMHNPCVRSCLQWCTSELGRITSIPDLWDNSQLDEYSSEYREEAENITVYCCLWDRWQSRQTKYTSPQHVLWMGQAEKLMGISASELLVMLCWMIMSASPPSGDRSESGLIRRARIGTVALSIRSDEELGSQFLDKFSWMNTLFTYPSERDSFVKTSRDYIRGFIQRRLMITLPNLDDCYDEFVDTDELDSTLEPITSKKSVSTGLPTFHLPRGYIQHQVKNTIREPDKVPPSSVSSCSDLPSPSMSELSQAIVSLLNLSSLHEASSSTKEILAAMLSNAKRQNCRIRERPS